MTKTLNQQRPEQPNLTEYEKLREAIRKDCGNEKCNWDCVECLTYHKKYKKIITDFNTDIPKCIENEKEYNCKECCFEGECNK